MAWGVHIGYISTDVFLLAILVLHIVIYQGEMTPGSRAWYCRGTVAVYISHVPLKIPSAWHHSEVFRLETGRY
jgi:hypothetical protein